MAAQHSHSLEGWFAHVPGIKVVVPAVPADAYGLLLAALRDPDPVFVFEHATLYPIEGEIDEAAGAAEIGRALVRRHGDAATVITYGGSLGKALEAADRLAIDGIAVEVIDLRSLRPLDSEAILASVSRTHRALIVDEGWRTGSISAEVTAQIMEGCFYALDAPVARVCGAEVPMPYAKHMEDAALPGVVDIVAATRGLLGGG
jgi:pyruvate/2-oxoglutarate/acetoin dehydrogenase E1 component